MANFMVARLSRIELVAACAWLVSAGGCTPTSRLAARAEAAPPQARATDLEHCWQASAGAGQPGAATGQRYCFTSDRWLWRRFAGDRWQQGDVSWSREARGDSVAFRTQLRFDAKAEPIELPGTRELEVTFSRARVNVAALGAPQRVELRRVSAAEERALVSEISTLVPVRTLCDRAKTCAELATAACNETPLPCDAREPLESTSSDCQTAIDTTIRELEARGVPIPDACAPR